MSSSSALLLRATTFAAEKHKNQRRKDASKTPYINHPIGVANYIASIGGVDDPNVLVAALLHDTVEDTNTTFEEIEKEFGKKIRDIVADVTDDKALSKDERKRKQVEHAPHTSTEAKLVKLGDKLYNLRDLREQPIASWGPERVQGYFVWAHQVIQGLRGTNAGLEKALDEEFASHFQVNGTSYPTLPAGDLAAHLEAYYKSMATADK
eukprot:TRINITY_DN7723_c0_g1_i1.p1 TRINITY_DN7723_c0_g1~~TRINITY_DN7723_c0_g1_i1.p1  ORF type:complete len:208 (-),score=67.82 TRINITY_DN7723_c0_g1_i1:123-746(-)